ncbi:Phage Terminase Small Subunit [Roseomonas mucosa]|uniref:Phage Terminase Small Subunit n=1 Tax=Roseomonas mucosa TaxID=207340 RepID=A0A4Y1MUL7_9PROT|nr:hypothetical protein [Roseomonas mucosa]AWV21725.1 Phage Terminase Small Subunit [Roseomonas mucosa]MDT8276711.1 hypothetical protein [Roseomonas mucosa]MDT8356806.1 hypothetical protein [Roseomonas mucosa]
MATDAELAAHLDISDRLVRELRKKGVFPEVPRGGNDLDGCRTAYIRHLRERAAGRQGDADAGDLDLVQERARLAKEQADATAMRNAQARGEMVPITAVTVAVVGAIELAKSRLLRVPAIVAKADGKLKLRIQTAVEDALDSLATVRVEDIAAGGTSADEPDGEQDEGDGANAG